MKWLKINLALIIFSITSVYAQEDKVSLRDTLDGKLDLSEYIIKIHGFIPVPMIITEPAVGNFGIAMGLVFISPRATKDDKRGTLFPDLTAAFGLYTLNKTWGAGLFRMGSFPKVGLRYRIGGGYVDAKLNFYREINDTHELKMLINLKPWVGMLEMSKNIYRNKIFGGLNYLYGNTTLQYDFQNIPDEIKDIYETEKTTATLSPFVDLDYRNSIFTPDKGMRLKTSVGFDDSFTGSDFKFQRYEVFTTVFLKLSPKWVCGLKAETKSISSDAPFYMKPYLTMRGIPAMRYQGETTMLFETEQRYDFNLRWSITAFAGSGRVFDNSEIDTDESWQWSGGAGFRYLVSRAFNLRMGVDVARGPEQFAGYIVFGHYWNR